MTSTPLLTRTISPEGLRLAATGPWTAAHAARLEQLVGAAARAGADVPQVAIDMARVDELDTAGAWLLERLSRSPDFAGRKTLFTGVKPRHRDLIEDMHLINRQSQAPHAGLSGPLAALDMIGRAVSGLASDVADFLRMSGE